MFIDQTYPFKAMPFSLFNCLDDCFGKTNLLIHYNQIYIPKIDKLNCLLSKYPFLQTYSLDEIIFNGHNIKIKEADTLKELSGSVYNHHCYFSSLCDKTYDIRNFKINSSIIKYFGSTNNFFDLFKQTALNLVGSGYVYLVCNEKGELSIFTTNNYDTPIPYNLYPLICLDMWEHSYFLKFNVNKEKYIDNFLCMLNIPYIDSEYALCLKCIK